MKRTLLIILFFVSSFTTGCDSTSSTDWNDYVGEYILTQNVATEESRADFLILKKDKTAVEFRYYKNIDQVLIKEKQWELLPRDMNIRIMGRNFPYIDVYLSIGGYSHPVEGSPPSIRITINDDLGLYYIKVR